MSAPVTIPPALVDALTPTLALPLDPDPAEVLHVAAAALEERSAELLRLRLRVGEIEAALDAANTRLLDALQVEAL